MIAASRLVAVGSPALAVTPAARGCSGTARPPVTAITAIPDAPAATLERMASEAHRRGSDEDAVRLWIAAARRDGEEGRPARRSQNLLRAGQALGALGYSGEAVALLEQARDAASPLGDVRLDAAVAGALAAIRTEQGDLERAQA